MAENTEKTFSFKDSLRESTKNNNNDSPNAHRYRGSNNQRGVGRQNSNDRDENDNGSNSKTTKCYQNNYYYNFNNNYAAAPNQVVFEQFQESLNNQMGNNQRMRRGNRRQVTFED